MRCVAVVPASMAFRGPRFSADFEAPGIAGDASHAAGFLRATRTTASAGARPPSGAGDRQSDSDSSMGASLASCELDRREGPGAHGYTPTRRFHPGALPAPSYQSVAASTQQHARRDPVPWRACHGHSEGLAPPAAAPLQHQPHHRGRPRCPRSSPRAGMRLEKAHCVIPGASGLGRALRRRCLTHWRPFRACLYGSFVHGGEQPMPEIFREGLWPSCWTVRRRSGRSRPLPGSAYAESISSGCAAWAGSLRSPGAASSLARARPAPSTSPASPPATSTTCPGNSPGFDWAQLGTVGKGRRSPPRRTPGAAGLSSAARP